MSHLLFIDDSRLEQQRISTLSGFLVTQGDYDRVRGAFREIKHRHLGDGTFPVKWSPSSERGPYQLQRCMSDQAPLRRDVCDLLGASDGVLMFACIDEGDTQYDIRKRRRYLLTAFEMMCQRAQMHLQGIDSHGRIITDTFGRDLNSALARHYFNLQLGGSSGPSFEIHFDRLDQDLMFSHQLLCDGLQLADFAAGAFGQFCKGRGEGYFERFRNKVRRKPGGGVKGYGVAVYPSVSTVVDEACSFCDSRIET